jgi:hypothetical protein
MSDSRRDFGLHVVFIDHFKAKLVITLIHSAVANLHTLHIIRAHAVFLSPQFLH